ncbi:hypothetical protein [Staphylococcus ratti]|uniref:Staphylococcal protein n=1 Tax=Staphylococcus ratti TaxID=2892440 RepID=A0ABY3PFG8_9STAP|nr:hypothetical protein [Staphylococcus ratti]UEX91083.1 hypothetical protein LN051_05560 [Staphylococcus ratti]
MSIGMIIFVITIVISIISAINDKSHEKRKQSPQQPPKSDQPKSFMEKVEKTLKDLEKEFDTESNEDTASPKEEQPKPKPQKTAKKESKPTASQSERVNHSQKEQQNIEKELLTMLKGDIDSLNDSLNRERQKHIERIERRARDIIDDKYLSPRTKRIKLKQLLTNSKQAQTDKGDLTFSDNEVVNGIIWSEVIDKRKQLS